MHGLSSIMVSVVVVFTLVLCIILSANAFRTIGSLQTKSRHSLTSTQPSKRFKHSLFLNKFGDVLNKVEARYGRSGMVISFISFVLMIVAIAFEHDNVLNYAVSALRLSKEQSAKLKEFQSLLRGEFSNRPGDMPTAIVDPRAKAITFTAKAVVYVALYFLVEAAVKKLLLWTNTDKKIKRATIVQQTKEVLYQ